MKKLDKKDLLLSPKVVTNLTGSQNGGREVSDHCPPTFPDCNTSADPGGCFSGNNQCLSEADNPCASDKNCTGDLCLLTGDNTCLCTNVCPETQSDNDQCCEASGNIDTKCCITHPLSIDICQESKGEICQQSNGCEDSQICISETILCP